MKIVLKIELNPKYYAVSIVLLLTVELAGISFAVADFGIVSECQLLECSRVVKWMLQIRGLFSTEPGVWPSESPIKSE